MEEGERLRYGEDLKVEVTHRRRGIRHRRRGLREDASLDATATRAIPGGSGVTPQQEEHTLAEDSDSSSNSSACLRVIQRHDRDADLEYFVKSGIACAILLAFGVWFTWSFYCNSKARRSTRERRGRLERPHSLGSFSSSGFSTVGSTNSSGIFQRDGHSAMFPCSEGTQVYNPMWTEQFQAKPAAGAVLTVAARPCRPNLLWCLRAAAATRWRRAAVLPRPKHASLPLILSHPAPFPLVLSGGQLPSLPRMRS